MNSDMGRVMGRGGRAEDNMNTLCWCLKFSKRFKLKINKNKPQIKKNSQIWVWRLTPVILECRKPRKVP